MQTVKNTLQEAEVFATEYMLLVFGTAKLDRDMTLEEISQMLKAYMASRTESAFKP